MASLSAGMSKATLNGDRNSKSYAKKGNATRNGTNRTRDTWIAIPRMKIDRISPTERARSIPNHLVTMLF